MKQQRPQFHFATALWTMLFAAVLLPVLLKIQDTLANSEVLPVFIFYYVILVVCFGVFVESFLRWREKQRR